MLIENRISHLIASQFPSVYQSDGDELIAFVQAYYEWLENSVQLLTLTDATGFAVGDSITQGPAGGEILAVSGSRIVVLSTRRLIDSESVFDSQSAPSVGYTVSTERRLNSTSGTYSEITSDRSSTAVNQALRGAEMFACIRFCDSLTLLTSSSGGSTTIEKAENTSYINLARMLPTIRDIDLTLEKFIVNFKEMYLKNIDFDIATNKRLLVKNTLDLYRAKGTERAIDLFFKLVYGTNSRVYNPGEDLWMLSDGQYTRPIYLEVTRAADTVNLVNKQIRGTVSGATAFVEKYIRRLVNNNFVYLLYLSNVVGTFENDELLRTTDTFSYDFPRVVGSLSTFSILSSSTGFAVGDIVNITSDSGSGAHARVTSIESTTGVVNFELVDGGWGYTSNSESIVSEKVLTLSNYQIGNSSVTGDYFALFETLTQPMANIEYSGTTSSLTDGTAITFANTTANTASGFIVSNPSANAADGTLHLSVTSGTVNAIGAGQDILLTANGADLANVVTVTDRSVTSQVMGFPDRQGGTVTLEISGLNPLLSPTGDPVGLPTITEGTVVRGQTGFGTGDFLDFTLNDFSATVETIVVDGSSATLVVNVTNGSILPGEDIIIFGRDGSNIVWIGADVDSISNITVGVYEANAVFAANAIITTANTEVTANVDSVSTGSLASFDVGTLSLTEDVLLNTDLLNANNTSNVAYMSLALNATAFGFPKSPSANVSATLYQALTFEDFTLGTIASLASVNPGTDYNVDPYVLARQPYIAGFNFRDYVISVDTVSQNFAVGEQIVQTNDDIIQVTLGVANSAMFQVGELVFQGVNTASQTANGIIDSLTANTVVVNRISGTFATSANVFSYMNTANSVTVDTVSSANVSATAYGVVKSYNAFSTPATLFVKRTQLQNSWIPGGNVVGQSTGATANIVSIIEDANTLPIGLNASITANVVTANGSVTGLEVVDSGFGYTDGQLASFVSQDGLRSGSIYLNRDGQGIATGYWRSNKGMVSSDKYLLDSDFYQEYSYQILSRIPFDKYRDSVLDVLHVAGTKLFGAVELESHANGVATVAETSIVSS